MVQSPIAYLISPNSQNNPVAQVRGEVLCVCVCVCAHACCCYTPPFTEEMIKVQKGEVMCPLSLSNAAGTGRQACLSLGPEPHSLYLRARRQLLWPKS